MRTPFEMRRMFGHIGSDIAVPAGHQRWSEQYLHEALPSTNDEAKALIAAQQRAGQVVIADHQTGGRGRLGRRWESPPHAGIAVSAVIEVPDLAAVGWLPLLTGLAVRQAVADIADVADVTGADATSPDAAIVLKWPNDLLAVGDDERKVGGILCELVPLARGHAVVVGVGINVDQQRDELPIERATSLALAGVEVSREVLLDALLPRLAALPALVDDERARAAYRAACVTIGREVRLQLPDGRSVEGHAVGVSDDGALQVSRASTTIAYAAGDVTHVRYAGSHA